MVGLGEWVVVLFVVSQVEWRLCVRWVVVVVGVVVAMVVLGGVGVDLIEMVVDMVCPLRWVSWEYL